MSRGSADAFNEHPFIIVSANSLIEQQLLHHELAVLAQQYNMLSKADRINMVRLSGYADLEGRYGIVIHCGKLGDLGDEEKKTSPREWDPSDVNRMNALIARDSETLGGFGAFLSAREQQ